MRQMKNKNCIIIGENMKIKFITLFLLLFLVINSVYPCSSGIQFLITVSPQFVDLSFFNEFSTFSQKVDDMAYQIINRNKNLALDKFEKAYAILFNIYQTYYKNPPPFYTDLKGFQKNMNTLTTIFSSFKEMIDNAMFATASEKLKSYVKFTNAFINPNHDWKPVLEKRKVVLSNLHLEDISYAIQSFINSFIGTKQGLKTRIKLGEITFDDKNKLDKNYLLKFSHTISPDFRKFMTFESSPITFADLIISNDLRTNLSKSTDYLIFGELLTPETVYLEFKDSKKGLVKKENSDYAFFRYKILSLKNLSIEVIDEVKVGIKIDTLYKKDGKEIISTHKLSYSIPSMRFNMEDKHKGPSSSSCILK